MSSHVFRSLKLIVGFVTLCSLTGCVSFFKNVAESFQNPWKQEVDTLLAETNDAIAKAFEVKDASLAEYEGAQLVYENTDRCLDAVSDIKNSDEYAPESRTLSHGGRAWPFSVQLGGDTVSVEDAYAFCANQMKTLGEASFESCGFSSFVMEMNIYGGTAEEPMLKPDWNPRRDYFTEDDRTLEFDPLSCDDMQDEVITPNAQPYADRLQSVCGENVNVWVPHGWRSFDETATHTIKVMDVRCYLQEDRRWFAMNAEDSLRTYE